MHRIPLYKWDGKEVIERAGDERQADVVPPAPPQPTAEQQRLAELTLKQAQQDTMIANLQQTNAQLLLQLAQTGGSVNV